MNHRLQLLLTSDVFQLMKDLVQTIEADSYGELVRRSLILVEHYKPIEELEHSSFILAPLNPIKQKASKRLLITLPDKSMNRLKELRGRLGDGGSYAEVIRRALLVFSNKIRKESKYAIHVS